MIETRIEKLSNPEGAVYLAKEILLQGDINEYEIYRIGIETGGFVTYVGKISQRMYDDFIKWNSHCEEKPMRKIGNEWKC